MVRETGASVVGIDIHLEAVEAAREQAAAAGLDDRSTFEVVDAARRLPFSEGCFSDLVCVDAINHFQDRASVLAEWCRILAPGGRLVYTDPIVVTGALTDQEMRVRSSIGFYLWVPAGLNERLLGEKGFEGEQVEDRTEYMARMARRWLEARRKREADLRAVEGGESFDGQQRFLETTARLAEERRLSRFVYYART